jgi:hypothetical protein
MKKEKYRIVIRLHCKGEPVVKTFHSAHIVHFIRRLMFYGHEIIQCALVRGGACT